MTVIKAGEAGPILRRLSTVDLADHLAEARAVIVKAKRQAARIEAGADRETRRAFEAAEKTGYQTGFEKGYAEGTTAGHKAGLEASTERFNEQHAHIVSAMERAVAEIDVIKADLALAAEKDLLDFAVRLAGRLTFAIGELHRESAQANLRRAIRLVGTKTDLAIRVNPADVASMETFAESVLKQAEASRAVTIVPDESFAPGGCRVECGRTEIDATLETQVEEMVSVVLGERAKDG